MHFLPILFLAAFIFSTQCFLFDGKNRRSLHSTVLHGRKTHRTLSELGKSKKCLFRELRDLCNKRMAMPGWMDDQLPQYEIVLYRLGNADVKQKGDCYLTQFLQMVMKKKNITHVSKFVNPYDLPAFIRDDFNGSLPLMDHNGTKLTGVMSILNYLETNFTNRTILPPMMYSFEEVLATTENFYPTLHKYISNDDYNLDPELELEMGRELDKVDKLCRSSPGRYVCGLDLSLSDLYLLSLLYNARVALKHFKDYDMIQMLSDLKRPALEKWFKRLVQDPDFTSSDVYIPADVVIWGWKVRRGDIAKPYKVERKIKT